LRCILSSALQNTLVQCTDVADNNQTGCVHEKYIWLQLCSALHNIMTKFIKLFALHNGQIWTSLLQI